MVREPGVVRNYVNIHVQFEINLTQMPLRYRITPFTTSAPLDSQTRGDLIEFDNSPIAGPLSVFIKLRYNLNCIR